MNRIKHTEILAIGNLWVGGISGSGRDPVPVIEIIKAAGTGSPS